MKSLPSTSKIVQNKSITPYATQAWMSNHYNAVSKWDGKQIRAFLIWNHPQDLGNLSTKSDFLVSLVLMLTLIRYCHQLTQIFITNGWRWCTLDWTFTNACRNANCPTQAIILQITLLNPCKDLVHGNVPAKYILHTKFIRIIQIFKWNALWELYSKITVGGNDVSQQVFCSYVNILFETKITKSLYIIFERFLVISFTR